MTDRELLSLKTGDIVQCNACPKYGCKNLHTKVEVREEECGCRDYHHTGNGIWFAYDATHCTARDHGKHKGVLWWQDVSRAKIRLSRRRKESHGH